MKILIACEFSGTVRDAFRTLGHDAWSCDLRPDKTGSRFHIQGDALEAVARGGWDLLIGHPPCTVLNVASVWALADPDFDRYPGVGYHQRVKPGTLTGKSRREAQEKAAAFFLALYHAPVDRVAIENPVGVMSTRFRKADQILQPYEFGSDASKKTGLWLRGLPLLTLDPAQRVAGRIVTHNGKTVERWANQTDSGQNRLSPSEDREAIRSVTYPGIARAMAQQWGGNIQQELFAA